MDMFHLIREEHSYAKSVPTEERFPVDVPFLEDPLSDNDVQQEKSNQALSVEESGNILQTLENGTILLVAPTVESVTCDQALENYQKDEKHLNVLKNDAKDSCNTANVKDVEPATHSQDMKQSIVMKHVTEDSNVSYSTVKPEKLSQVLKVNENNENIMYDIIKRASEKITNSLTKNIKPNRSDPAVNNYQEENILDVLRSTSVNNNESFAPVLDSDKSDQDQINSNEIPVAEAHKITIANKNFTYQKVVLKSYLISSISSEQDRKEPQHSVCDESENIPSNSTAVKRRAVNFVIKRQEAKTVVLVRNIGEKVNHENKEKVKNNKEVHSLAKNELKSKEVELKKQKQTNVADVEYINLEDKTSDEPIFSNLTCKEVSKERNESSSLSDSVPELHTKNVVKEFKEQNESNSENTVSGEKPQIALQKESTSGNMKHEEDSSKTSKFCSDSKMSKIKQKELKETERTSSPTCSAADDESDIECTVVECITIEDDEVEDEIDEEEADEVDEEEADEVDEEEADEIDEEAADEIDEEAVDKIDEEEADEIDEEAADEVDEEEADEIDEEAADEIDEEAVDKIDEEEADEIDEEAADEIDEEAADEIDEEAVDKIDEEAADDIDEEAVDEIDEEENCKEPCDDNTYCDNSIVCDIVDLLDFLCESKFDGNSTQVEELGEANVDDFAEKFKLCEANTEKESSPVHHEPERKSEGQVEKPALHDFIDPSVTKILHSESDEESQAQQSTNENLISSAVNTETKEIECITLDDDDESDKFGDNSETFSKIYKPITDSQFIVPNNGCKRPKQYLARRRGSRYTKRNIRDRSQRNIHTSRSSDENECSNEESIQDCFTSHNIEERKKFTEQPENVIDNPLKDYSSDQKLNGDKLTENHILKSKGVEKMIIDSDTYTSDTEEISCEKESKKCMPDNIALDISTDASKEDCNLNKSAAENVAQNEENNFEDMLQKLQAMQDDVEVVPETLEEDRRKLNNDSPALLDFTCSSKFDGNSKQVEVLGEANVDDFVDKVKLCEGNTEKKSSVQHEPEKNSEGKDEKHALHDCFNPDTTTIRHTESDKEIQAQQTTNENHMSSSAVNTETKEIECITLDDDEESDTFGDNSETFPKINKPVTDSQFIVPNNNSKRPKQYRTRRFCSQYTKRNVGDKSQLNIHSSRSSDENEISNEKSIQDCFTSLNIEERKKFTKKPEIVIDNPLKDYSSDQKLNGDKLTENHILKSKGVEKMIIDRDINASDTEEIICEKESKTCMPDNIALDISNDASKEDCILNKSASENVVQNEENNFEDMQNMPEKLHAIQDEVKVVPEILEEERGKWNNDTPAFAAGKLADTNERNNSCENLYDKNHSKTLNDFSNEMDNEIFKEERRKLNDDSAIMEEVILEKNSKCKEDNQNDDCIEDTCDNFSDSKVEKSRNKNLKDVNKKMCVSKLEETSIDSYVQKSSCDIFQKNYTKASKNKRKSKLGSFAAGTLADTNEQNNECGNFNDKIDFNTLNDFSKQMDSEKNINSDKEKKVIHIENAKRDQDSNSSCDKMKEVCIQIKKLTNKDIVAYSCAAEHLAKGKNEKSKNKSEENKGASHGISKNHMTAVQTGRCLRKRKSKKRDKKGHKNIKDSLESSLQTKYSKTSEPDSQSIDYALKNGEDIMIDCIVTEPKEPSKAIPDSNENSENFLKFPEESSSKSTNFLTKEQKVVIDSPTPERIKSLLKKSSTIAPVNNFKKGEINSNVKPGIKNSKNGNKLIINNFYQNQTTDSKKRTLSFDESKNNVTDTNHSQGNSLLVKKRSISLSEAKEKSDAIGFGNKKVKIHTSFISAESVQENKPSNSVSKGKRKKHRKDNQRLAFLEAEPALFSQPDLMVKVDCVRSKEKKPKSDVILKVNTSSEKHKIAKIQEKSLDGGGSCCNLEKSATNQFNPSVDSMNAKNSDISPLVGQMDLDGKSLSALHEYGSSKDNSTLNQHNCDSGKTNANKDVACQNVNINIKIKDMENFKKMENENVESETMVLDNNFKKSPGNERTCKTQIFGSKSSKNELILCSENKAENSNALVKESSSCNNTNDISSKVNSKCSETHRNAINSDRESSEQHDHQKNDQHILNSHKNSEEKSETEETAQGSPCKKTNLCLETLSSVSLPQSNCNEKNQSQGRRSVRLLKKRKQEVNVSPESTNKILSKKESENSPKEDDHKKLKRKRKSETEDDPDKLWCICRKPHNNRFMIQCDSCKEWYHGSCVGINRNLGLRLEKEKREWKCPLCTQKIAELEEMDCSESNPIILEKKNEKPSCGSSTKECVVHPVVSSSSHLKSPSVYRRLDSVLQAASRKDVESTDTCLKKPIVGKELETFDSNHENNAKTPSETHKPKPESKCEIKINPKTSNVATAITSVEKSVKNVNQKDANSGDQSSSKKGDKVPTQAKPKVKRCIACPNRSLQNSCYCSDECIENHAAYAIDSIRITKGLKGLELDNHKLVVYDRVKGYVINGDRAPSVKEAVEWLKSHQNYIIACKSTSSKARKEPSISKKEAEAVESKKSCPKQVESNVRSNVRKSLKEILMKRCTNSDDFKKSEEFVHKVAMKIEDELYAAFKEDQHKYSRKYRSLMFNIKDPRNQGLFRKVLDEIPPEDLVRMSHEELASQELAQWREKEAQHCLDIIKRVNLEQQKFGNASVLKKTHKGEVEIEDDLSTVDEDIPKVTEEISLDECRKSEKFDKPKPKDTTQDHRSHLFCQNCKICIGIEQPPTDHKGTPNKVRVAHSISLDLTSESPEKPSSETVLEKSSMDICREDSKDQEPTSTVSIESPESHSLTEKTKVCSVWKGFIYMQDVAKFLTTAYKVSGNTVHLQEDVPDVIQVCGRIRPNQVWQYLSKIKQAGNKELVVIRFKPANEEELATYDSFYTYLSSRKRYGVASNYSKRIKDFYILPLAATSPVPIVLMPFDGPGLPSNRPHLLLGVIVKHKMKPGLLTPKEKGPIPKSDYGKQADCYTPPSVSRSYTPPLPSSNQEEVKKDSNASGHVSSTHVTTCLPVEEEADECSSDNQVNHGKLRVSSYEPSYAPPLKELISKILDEEKPYDPEQDILNLVPEKQETVINLDNLNTAEHLSQSAIMKNISKVHQEIKLCDDTIYAIKKGKMTSYLNLVETFPELTNVAVNPDNQETDEEKDVDMRISNLFGGRLNHTPDTSLESSSKETLEKTQEDESDFEGKCSSQGATPPAEDDDTSSEQSSDPRIKLRTCFDDGKFTSKSTNVSLSHMSASDLVKCAQKQLSETKDTEYLSSQKEVSLHNLVNISSPFSENDYLAYSWNSEEPPPPGLETKNLSPNENAYIEGFANSHVPNNNVQSSYNTDLAEEAFQVKEIAPSPALPAVPPPLASSYQTYLPPGFSVQTPPPNFKIFPPPVLPTSFPLPPPPAIPPPMPIGALTEQSKHHFTEESWPSWQVSEQPPQNSNWHDQMSFNDFWEHSSKNCYSNNNSQSFVSERSEENATEHSFDKSWNMHPPRMNRGNWQNYPSRGNRWENQRRGRRAFPYRKSFLK